MDYVMEQTIFDSRASLDIVDDIFNNWERWSDFERPKDPSDIRILETATDVTRFDYEEVVGRFKKEFPASCKVLLVGRLGLWCSSPFAYRISDASHCMDSDFDFLEILYKDGDIYKIEFHHDGVNRLKVRGIRGRDDIDSSDLEFYDGMIHSGIYISENDIDVINRITFSVAPYFSEFLCDSAQKEIEGIKHETERMP